jgi:hypothetical protein
MSGLSAEAQYFEPRLWRTRVRVRLDPAEIIGPNPKGFVVAGLRSAIGAAAVLNECGGLPHS